MSSDEEERALRKQIFKNPVEVQKARLDRLMTNVQKPVFIPEKKETKLPRAFQPHEFVRNVMGASAGAGSGEFDIYRGCRRRQIIREAYLNRMAKEQEAKEEWEAKVENNRIKSENQAAKKRKKRLKRKGRSKNPKSGNDKNSPKSDESSSSSSDNEEEEEETKTSDPPPASIVEEDQPEKKEPTPPPHPPVQQQHEKTDIRQHLRHRKSSSSDEGPN